ncbi:MAG TPA: hypothetical protein VHU23_04070 [Rhizomicrobium sp.]|jgi:hypothetical protein|nr:hypothetical protein [Rhizomicrobium sp.]
MFVKLMATTIFLLASTGVVVAQEMCGDLPIGPVIPSAPDIAKKSAADAAAAQRGVFLDVKRWQGALKSYRDCLNATDNTDRRELGEAQRGGDKTDTKRSDKLTAEITDLRQAWNASADEEERVVNEFHAMQTAYCGRKDVDRASCPKT